MGTFHATFKDERMLNSKFGETQKIETGNYNNLSNKPQINSVTLEGNKESDELRLQGKMQILSQTEIEKILYLGR